MEKLLIITADDFGYSHNRNRGIVEAFQTGAVTRASLLVNAEASQEAVELANQHSILLGLHLNLTEGHPLSAKEDVFTLIGSDGMMLGKTDFRNAVKEGFVNLKEVEIEMHAQIRRFNEICKKIPLYVDGHMHVHVLPGITKVFATVLKQHGISETRLPIEMDVGHCAWLQSGEREFYDTTVQQARKASEVFSSAGIKFSDCFVGMVTMGYNMTTDRLISQLSDAFNCARRCVQKSAEHSCANNTSTSSIAQGDCTPRYCDTNGCERSEFSSIESEHGSDFETTRQLARNTEQDTLVDDFCELKQVGRSYSVDIPNCNSTKKTIDNGTGNVLKDKLGTNSEQQIVSTGERYKVVVELMVHPGYPSNSGDPGCGSGADEFACSSARKQELDILSSKQMLEWHIKEDITLISQCTD